FNNIFISNMGGDFFRLFYISKQANNSSAAVSTVFLDRFLGFTMLTFLAIMGGIYWSGAGGLAQIWPILLVLMFTWVLVIFVLFNKKLGIFFRFLLKWFVSEKILIKLRDIYNLIYDFSRDKRLLAYLFSISFVIQLSRVFIHYFAGRAVGVEIGFVPFLIFIPIIALFASLPISVGGLGVREQTGVILFRRVGIPMAVTIPMEFLAYLLTVVCSLPGILFFVLIDKRRNQDEKS
ncbi:MAG TPA: flippase-like domain-containing protein, partial [Bacteroidetes bacterium]|nr:flippase-like domain-containing protein [Bacteroidota bacterium]